MTTVISIVTHAVCVLTKKKTTIILRTVAQFCRVSSGTPQGTQPKYVYSIYSRLTRTKRYVKERKEEEEEQEQRE